MVEVGPGGGVLTRELARSGARVLGVELDPRWAFVAQRELAGVARIVVADALGFPWERLPAGTLVAGNLPYNVSTAIIRELLPHSGTIPRAAFLVQREVADRMVADVGAPAYGSLSVLVRAWSEPRILGRVRPGSFNPPPKVDSAFVGLRLRPPVMEPEAMAGFTATVRQAFAHKRKTLRNALSSGWGRERAQAVLERLGWSQKARAEELSLTRFVELHRVRVELEED